MGGPPLSEEMKRVILETWFRMRTTDYEPVSKEVRASVVRQLEKEGYTESEIPKLRTFQEYLRRARKRQITLEQESKVDEQKPWNMQTLDEFPLPPESIPQVLQVWRYSVNLGAKFTIRHAKWASRLYSQVSDTTKLWFVSRRYCREEELALLTDTKMKIFMLDSFLVMGGWERRAAIFTDVLKPDNPIGYVKHTVIPYVEDGGIAEELINALPFDPWWDIEGEKEAVRAHEISRLIRQLPSSSLFFQDFETRMVYLRQLSYIANGPKWNQFSPEEVRDIIIELRNWVSERKSIIDELYVADKNSRDIGVYMRKQIALDTYPGHLYILAGFTEYSPKEEQK